MPNPITLAALAAAMLDADTLAGVVNDPAVPGTVTAREGAVIRTLKKLEADAQTRIDKMTASSEIVNAIADKLEGFKAIYTPGSGYPFDRYLDTNAAASGNGLTPNTPKNTMAEVLAMGSITAGVSIGIARGSKLGTTILTGDNIRVGSYGALGTPAPIFDPSILLAPTGWAAQGTYAGMYTQAVAGYVDGDLKNIGNVVWLNQATGKYVVLKQYATVAALNAAASGVFVSGWNTATLTVSLKPGATYGHPSVSGQEYRVATGYALRVLGNNASVSDVTAQNAGEQNGCIEIGASTSVSTVRRVTSLNGSRHNSLFGPGAVVEDCVFAGGDNQLEAGQGSNGTVLFTTDWAGKTFTLRRCTFENNDGNGMIAVDCHDVTNTGPMLPALIEDCTFISTYVAAGLQPNGAKALLVRPVFKTGLIGTVCYQIGSFNFETQFAKGIVNMVNDSGTGSYTLYDSDLLMPSLGGGQRQSAVYIPAASGGPSVRLVRGTYKIGSKILGYGGHNSAFAVMNSGSFAAEGVTFKMDGCFHAADMTHGWDLGGTATISGGNNRWPFGIKFARNGTTYVTLAAAQAAGYEAGSTSEPVPVPSASSDFTAVPNGNLEGVTGWTRLPGADGAIGAAGAFDVVGGKVGPARGSNSSYKRGNTPVAGSYTRHKVEAFGDYVFVTQKMTEAGDYYLGTSVNSNGYAYVYHNEVYTTGTVIVSSRPVIVGTILTTVVKVLDALTGRMGIWLYADGESIGIAEFTNPVIAAASAVGCASVGFNVAGRSFSGFSAGSLT